MQIQSLTHFSPSLGRDMHMMIYGRGGMPFLAFPTQDGMCRQYEDFGVIDQISDFIENGRIQLFVVDTVDAESWSAKGADNTWRTARQEQYYHYIVDEVVPLMREKNGADGVARVETRMLCHGALRLEELEVVGVARVA